MKGGEGKKGNKVRERREGKGRGERKKKTEKERKKGKAMGKAERGLEGLFLKVGVIWLQAKESL